MYVEVRTYATLCKYTKQKTGIPFTIELEENTQVNRLVDILGIPADEVKLYIVNGRSVEKDYVLKKGDRVSLFPPLAGG